MLHLGDITKIKGNEAPVVDCVTFGAPCQDLSVAGKRKGMLHESRGDEETSRSGLFHEAIRIIKEMRENDRLSKLHRGTDESIRPRYAVYENVPGAFSSNKGEDFRVVLEEVARIVEEGVSIPRPEKGKWSNSGVIIGDGWSIAWRVFDAQYWGVPQRRKRICLVADFNGHSAAEIVFNEAKQYRCTNGGDSKSSFRDIGAESRSEVQPVCEGLPGDTEQSREEGQEASSYAAGSIGTGHPAFTYQDREGCAGGGKGFLLQEDRSASLRTNNFQTVFQPVETVALEGNGQRPSHMGDGYSVSDKSYTLNSTEVHGVAYAVDMGGGKSACDIIEDKSPTLCTTHYGEPAVCFAAHGFGNYEEMNAVGSLMCGQNATVRGDTPLVVEKKNYFDAEMEVEVRKYPVDIEKLKTVLRDNKKGLTNKYIADRLNKPLTLVEHWFRQDDCFAIPDPDIWFELKNMLGIDTDEFDESVTTFETKAGNYDMRNRIYNGNVSPTLSCGCGNNLYLLPSNSVVSIDRETFNSGQNFAQKLGIREDGIQPTLVARGPGAVCYTSSHGGFMTNFTEGTAHTLEASDYKDAPMIAYYNCVAEVDCRNCTEDDVNGALQATACHNLNSNNVVRVRYIVRRLTPLECERLQGYPDGWTDIGDYIDSNGKKRKVADSNRYKALGNSIALPSWRWVLKRMCANYERPATMASLFDGISGFTWLWTQINGRNSVLWTSEIEDFPSEVCKRHFGNEAKGEIGDYETFL